MSYVRREFKLFGSLSGGIHMAAAENEQTKTRRLQNTLASRGEKVFDPKDLTQITVTGTNLKT